MSLADKLKNAAHNASSAISSVGETVSDTANSITQTTRNAAGLVGDAVGSTTRGAQNLVAGKASATLEKSTAAFQTRQLQLSASSEMERMYVGVTTALEYSILMGETIQIGAISMSGDALKSLAPRGLKTTVHDIVFTHGLMEDTVYPYPKKTTFGELQELSKNFVSSVIKLTAELFVADQTRKGVNIVKIFSMWRNRIESSSVVEVPPPYDKAITGKDFVNLCLFSGITSEQLIYFAKLGVHESNLFSEDEKIAMIGAKEVTSLKTDTIVRGFKQDTISTGSTQIGLRRISDDISSADTESNSQSVVAVTEEDSGDFVDTDDWNFDSDETDNDDEFAGI